MMAPSGNPQMMAMMGGSLPGGMQVMPVGANMPMMMQMAMDKGQQGQSGMTGIAMNPMGAMGAMGGMNPMGGMGGMGVIPMMMGGGGANPGMGQGFMMPMMQSAMGNQGSTDKSKQN